MSGRIGLRWVEAVVGGSQSANGYVRSVRVEKGRLEMAGGAAGHLVGLSRLLLGSARDDGDVGKTSGTGANVTDRANRSLMIASFRTR